MNRRQATLGIVGIIISAMLIYSVMGSTLEKPKPPATSRPAIVVVSAFPVDGMKIIRAEFDPNTRRTANRVEDQIMYQGPSINTHGLAAMGLPGVEVNVGFGNATDFYRGRTEMKDGGQVEWRWSQFQQHREPWHGAWVTVTAKDGTKKIWQLTAVKPPTSRPVTPRPI